MPKSTFTDAYATAINELVAVRKALGVSQVELALRLGKTQQFVSLIEQRDRRLDLVEFYAFARALHTDPVALFERIARTLPDEVSI